MKLLERIFNYEIDQRSPIQTDRMRKVDFDEDGNEIISWTEIDYEKLQQSLGTVNDWSLTNLLKAGINPDFPIHTGYNTRLEGVNIINNLEGQINEIFEHPEYDTTPINENKNEE